MYNIYKFMNTGIPIFVRGQNVGGAYELIQAKGFVMMTNPKFAAQVYNDMDLFWQLMPYVSTAAYNLQQVLGRLPNFAQKDACIAAAKKIEDHLNEYVPHLSNNRRSLVMQDAVDSSILSTNFTLIDNALGAYFQEINARVGNRANVFFTLAGQRKAYLDVRYNELNGKFNRTLNENKEFNVLAAERTKIQVAIDLGTNLELTIGAAAAAIAMGEAEQALLKAFPPSIKVVSKNAEKANIKVSILGFDLPEMGINQSVNTEIELAQKDAKGNVLKTYAENYTLIVEGDEEMRTVKAYIVANETGDTIVETPVITFPAPVVVAPPPAPPQYVQPVVSENQVGALIVPQMQVQAAPAPVQNFGVQAQQAQAQVLQAQQALDAQKQQLAQAAALEAQIQDQKNKLELAKLQGQMELEEQKLALELEKAKFEMQAKTDLNTIVGLAPKPPQIPEPAPAQSIAPLYAPRSEAPAPEVPKTFFEENKTAILAGGGVGVAALAAGAYFIFR